MAMKNNPNPLRGSMNEIQIFNSDQFGEIHAFMQDGTPWFVAKEVAEALGYAQTDQAIRIHCKYAKLFRPLEIKGLEINPRGMYFIPEPDVYALIFGSTKSEAETFKKWVFEDVLPSIRKHGVYGTEDFMTHALSDPAWGVEQLGKALQSLHFEREQRALAESQRDEAIRTKAWIGSKREASAMQAASVQSKKVKQLEAKKAELENELGYGQKYKRTTAISWIREIFTEDSHRLHAQLGRKLSDFCKENGYPIETVQTSRYPIHLYPVDGIAAFRGELDKNPMILKDFRKIRNNDQWPYLDANSK